MSVYNEYSKLTDVILGICPAIYAQKELPDDMLKGMNISERIVNNWAYKLYKNNALPDKYAKNYRKELEALNAVLINNDVMVYRLDPIEPFKNEPEGLIQMFARDPAISIGDNFIFGSMRIPMRQKEYRAYEKLLPKITQFRMKTNSLVQSSGLFLEGGDVIVDYPYVFVGINTYATNINGLRWLEQNIDKDFQIVPIYINDPTIMHLDCCMTIIGPKLAIIHRESIREPLPPQLKDYQFIEIDSKTRKELGTNVLVINPTTIIVQKRHLELQSKLAKLGFKVIPIDFTKHADTHGAFRCVTCPIHRG